jgi:hypothetical protein
MKKISKLYANIGHGVNMKSYRVYFQVTEDFFEVVTADSAEKAVQEAQAYVDENLSRSPRFGSSRAVDVVKVEETEPVYV